MKDGWFTPEALTRLRDLVRDLAALPQTKHVTAITNVPLLRNLPPTMMGPQIATLVDPKTGDLAWIRG
jgi:hypothetical protein